jgi:hypothetical protein
MPNLLEGIEFSTLHQSLCSTGECYYQPYSPMRSTETRLCVVASDGVHGVSQRRSWDHQEYWESCFFFNTVVRQSNGFLHGIEGLSNTYDSAVEVNILRGFYACCSARRRADLLVLLQKIQQKQGINQHGLQDGQNPSLITSGEDEASSFCEEKCAIENSGNFEAGEKHNGIENKFVAALSSFITHKIGGAKAMEWKLQDDTFTSMCRRKDRQNSRHRNRKRKWQRDKERLSLSER